MKTRLFAILIVLFTNNLFAQTCVHTGLSKKFNYRIAINKTGNETNYKGPITVTILSKQTGKIHQTIQYQTEGLMLDYDFTNCNFDRSHITKRNLGKEIDDYDYGDIIVADLNFDGKEDFAIKRASGGNGGPQYNYYIQDEKGVFIIDKYLSEEVWPFPQYINKSKKTIVVITHANVHQEKIITFKYNETTKSWKFLKLGL